MTLYHIAASDVAHGLGWNHHFDGWVISPAYAWWSKQTYRIEPNWPVIVDNGAWSDHTAGRDSTPADILMRTLKTADLIPESSVKFMCLPDKVGCWKTTIEYLHDILDHQFKIGIGTPFERVPKFPFAVVIQDNFNVEELEDILEKVEQINGVKPWIFIGGSSFDFKCAAITIVKNFLPNYQIHVGKIHKLRDVVHCIREGVDSIDTSTFSRPPTPTYAKTLTQRLEHIEAWRNGDQTILSDWSDA